MWSCGELRKVEMVRPFFRLAKAWNGYRRPLWLGWQRLSGRRHVVVTDRATGLSFRCLAGADRMLGDVFHTQLYDIPLCPVRAGDRVVDVGANHGFSACWFAARGAQVLAFEPSAVVFRLLEENLATNRLGERVSAMRVAVSDHEGVAVLTEAPELGGGMSTIEPSFAATSGAHYGSGQEVPSWSIGRVLEEASPSSVRLLKLDCEGSELPILKALDGGMRRRIDSIALEYHANAYPVEELFDLLLSWPEFHLSQAASPGIANAVLHLVRREVLAERTESGAPR